MRPGKPDPPIGVLPRNPAAGFRTKIGKRQMTKRTTFNRKRVFLVVLLLCACFGLLAPAEETAPNQDAQAKAAAMIEDWKAITPKLLQAPENVPVINQLKTIAQERPASTAVVLLLRYGDEQTVQRLLTQLRAKTPRDRGSAVQDLSLAAKPQLIRLLDRDLLREESSELVFLGDTLMLPVSMAAASIIKATIIEGPVFSPDVKEWAKGLPKVSGGLRDGIRAWWKINKAAIERGDYQAVVPVEPVRGASAATPTVPATPAQVTPMATRRQTALPLKCGGVPARSPLAKRPAVQASRHAACVPL